MELYWTHQYQHGSANLHAEQGTTLLVIGYEEVQMNWHRSRYSGTHARLEALEIAKVFATELIDDRVSQLLYDEPKLVFQVQQLEC